MPTHSLTMYIFAVDSHFCIQVHILHSLTTGVIAEAI
jgi:hypothetical protein